MKLINRFLPIFLIFAVFGISFFDIFPHSALAQAADPCNSGTVGKSNAELQADLDACNVEIAKWTDILNSTKKNTASYATEVSKLTAKINAAKATINAKNKAIASLNTNITQKQTQINTLQSQIAADSESVAELLRKTNEIDAFSVAEAVLSDKDFSTFFADVGAYSTTRASLLAIVDNLRGVKSQTETQKIELAKQRDAEADAKAVIEANKKKVEASQAEQKTLLTQSQNQEKAFTQVVADKKAKAEAIRTALFGLRDSAAIPFGTALGYAQTASTKTGVRPALILAILQQESNLGANVGTCVITDLSSGQTRNVNSGKVYANGIHPTRDLPLLQALLPALGRDPLTTKVSCPLSIGYGGAMGPAQFIPSTWNIMRNQIATYTGKTSPDPWDPADAIMALAILLKNNGASAGTYTAERTAACRYYGGGTSCTSTTGVYGNQVMSRVTNIQANIDVLQDS
ncbi:lytic murein transglycosylase [Candidatus Parcubacteria bacterium]|nr:lytic murein transglycosylase [Candidatus Parcubacteria bacterium]